MKIEETISEALKEHILNEDQFLIKVQLQGTAPGRQKLLVVADSIKGLGIDECAVISRGLSDFLESEELIDNAYQLEVTSPGADAVFTDPRQYIKNIGRQVQLNLNDQSTLIGILHSATDQQVILLKVKKEKGKKATTEEVVVPLEDIQKAKVVISF